MSNIPGMGRDITRTPIGGIMTTIIATGIGVTSGATVTLDNLTRTGIASGIITAIPDILVLTSIGTIIGVGAGGIRPVGGDR